MISQTFSRGASIRELDETENTCSDAKGGSREELDILCGFWRDDEDKRVVLTSKYYGVSIICSILQNEGREI